MIVILRRRSTNYVLWWVYVESGGDAKMGSGGRRDSPLYESSQVVHIALSHLAGKARCSEQGRCG